MQDSSVIMDSLAFQRAELERTLTKARAIESEISRLETDLYNLGESLNNPRVCFNPIAFAQKSCEQCVFYRRCSYEAKRDYGRFKL